MKGRKGVAEMVALGQEFVPGAVALRNFPIAVWISQP